jgi:hypothetical protein
MPNVVELIQVRGASKISVMKLKTIVYWTSTALLSLAMLAGGIADLVQPETIRAGFEHLGYPLVLASILGVWKLLGVTAIAAPGLPRLKEWAYAGFTINLTSAFVSHLAAGDRVADWAGSIMLLAFVMVSWALRPASRRLGTPVPETERSASAQLELTPARS